ncbi:MAG: pentapeptide repeat-containing protein [Blastocatellia bacterium]
MPIDITQLAHLNLFIEEVAGFYRSLGFDVEQRQVTAEVPVHLFIRKRIAGVPTQAVVECLNHQLSPKERSRIRARLQGVSEQFPSHRPIVLSAQRLPNDARLEFETALIGCTAYPDLIREFVPLEAYAGRLLNESAERRQDEDWFVEPDIMVDGEIGRRPAIAYLNDWLRDSKASLLLVLGDTGMGKSVLLRQQALEMAKAFLRDPLRHAAPVLIRMGEIRQAISWESILLHHFGDLGFPGLGVPQLDYLAKRGRVVFLFDAFDEMPDQVRADLIRDNFRELTRSIETGEAGGGGWKAVFSCRTQYFRDRQERRRLLGQEQDLLDLPDLPNLEVVRLRELTDRQVNAYLERAFPQNAHDEWVKIETVYHLSDLARRPVLLRMIVKSLPDCELPINAANLYSSYARSWLEREDQKGRLLDREVKLTLMTELAWWMWFVEKESIHHSKLTSFVERLFEEEHLSLAGNDLPEISREVAAGTFLKRDGAGNYSFIHRSFQEYFLACKLFGALVQAGEDADGRNQARKILRTRPFTSGTIRFLTLLDEERQTEPPLQLFLRERYVPQVSENALHLLYWIVRTRLGMEKQVEAREKLRAAMEKSIPAGVQLAGANLQQATFEAIVLRDANFQNADLRDADFNHADLQGGDFRGADLQDASFVGATMAGCDFRGAIGLETDE